MAKSKDKSIVDNTTSLEIVNIYFNEWKYRHENFWKRLTQFAIITFFTSSMPITYCVFGGIKLPSFSRVVFPIFGIILAFVSYVFCMSEYKRLEAVGNTIKRIIEQQLGKSYAKEELTAKGVGGLYNVKIGVLIPRILIVMQITLAFFVICMIVNKKI